MHNADWRWHYSYSYGPFIQDLCDNLGNKGIYTHLVAGIASMGNYSYISDNIKAIFGGEEMRSSLIDQIEMFNQ